MHRHQDGKDRRSHPQTSGRIRQPAVSLGGPESLEAAGWSRNTEQIVAVRSNITQVESKLEEERVLHVQVPLMQLKVFGSAVPIVWSARCERVFAA